MSKFVLYVFIVGITICSDVLGKTINPQDYYFINVFGCSFPVPNSFNFIGDRYFNSGDVMFSGMGLDTRMEETGMIVLNRSKYRDGVPHGWGVEKEVSINGLNVKKLIRSDNEYAFKDMKVYMVTDGKIYMEYTSGKSSKIDFESMLSYCYSHPLQ